MSSVCFESCPDLKFITYTFNFLEEIMVEVERFKFCFVELCVTKFQCFLILDVQNNSNINELLFMTPFLKQFV